MEDLEKRIQINDNRLFIYEITEGCVRPVYTIREGFLDNKQLTKSYSFSQSDDYVFNGWLVNDEETNLNDTPKIVYHST